MYDVITFGSATVDVFAKTKFSELITIKTSEGTTDLLAYPTGSKILIEELEFTTGGGATNAAAALARLGHKVACVSKMGAQSNSERILEDLKKEKIDFSLIIRKKDARTSYSIILDSLKHDRTILTFKGSTNNLKFSELNLKKLKSKWFYFATLIEESFKTLEQLSEFAEKNKIKIIFNTSSYLAKKGPEFLAKILKRTEVLVLNKEEAQMLTDNKDQIKDLLKELQLLGPKIVVITDGKHGAYVYDGSHLYSAIPHNIKVVETTGAGDAFASSFLSGLIKKNNIEHAIKMGITNSESVISYHGAKNKLLTYKNLLKQLIKRPVKVKKEKI